MEDQSDLIETIGSNFTRRIIRNVFRLEGILRGIAADRVITVEELAKLNEWLSFSHDLMHLACFRGLNNALWEVTSKRRISSELLTELLRYCSSFYAPYGSFRSQTDYIRILHGFLHGIAIDEVIEIEELKALRNWMLEHREILQGTWPYDELGEILDDVLGLGGITKNKHEELLSFFSEFIEGYNYSGIETDKSFDDLAGDHEKHISNIRLKTVEAVCDPNVKIEFAGKNFCFTGLFASGKRKYLHTLTERLGGVAKKNISLQVDYLIIGDNSSPCWTYSTYGRKIEKAIEIKKRGGNLSITKETIFIDAVTKTKEGR